MSNAKWEVVETVAGAFQAEILRGLLEAQGISVTLSQEGAGHYAYALTVGTLGQVEILVPSSELQNARQVLEDYHKGIFEATESFDESAEAEEEDQEKAEDD